MKFVLVFLVIFMSIAVNLPDGMIARLGIDPNYLLAGLLALSITGLIVHRRLALIVLIIFMSLGANLPEGLFLGIGIDRDYLAAGLVAIVFTPYILYWLE